MSLKHNTTTCVLMYVFSPHVTLATSSSHKSQPRRDSEKSLPLSNNHSQAGWQQGRGVNTHPHTPTDSFSHVQHAQPQVCLFASATLRQTADLNQREGPRLAIVQPSRLQGADQSLTGTRQHVGNFLSQTNSTLLCFIVRFGSACSHWLFLRAVYHKLHTRRANTDFCPCGDIKQRFSWAASRGKN